MENLNVVIDISEKDKLLLIKLIGSVDHHTAREAREKIDSSIKRGRIKTVILDLGEVEFMDSSGLGLILGRYARVCDLGGKFILKGISDEIMKIIRLAGIEKFIPIEKNGGNNNEKKSEKQLQA